MKKIRITFDSDVEIKRMSNALGALQIPYLINEELKEIEIENIPKGTTIEAKSESISVTLTIT